MNAVQSGAFFFTPTTLMPLIVSDFRLPMSLSTVPIAVGKIAYVLLLIPGGILVDRIGPRRCVITGIFGLATILTSYALFVTGFTAQIVCHVLMAVFASVSGVPVYSLFIAQWFEGGIGLAMGLVLAGYSAAGTAMPALLGPIAAAMGWRVAMTVMCSVLWFVGLPVSYFLLHEFKDDGADVEAESQPLVENSLTASAIPERPLADQVSWTFVGFAFSYILLQYCFGCFGENIMFFLTIDRDVTLGLASLFFSALNLASFSAKLIGGHLGDQFDRFHVAAAASGLASIGIFFLFIAPPGLDDNNVPILTNSAVALILFTVLFGFGYGATFNSLYALTPIVFGKQNLGRTQSALFGLGLCGNALGSVLTAVLRSAYDTYQRPFLVAAVACTANFFVFNVTRLTLGGTIEGLKKLQESDITETSPYMGAEALDSTEEAIKLRAGAMTPSGLQRSPIGSYQSLRSPLPGDVEGYAIRRSHSRHSGTGMLPEDGFPIVRDWSNSSLRNTLRRMSDNEDAGSVTPLLSRSSSRQGMRMRRSSTLEAMINSGILSASLEAVGYVGTTESPRRSALASPRAFTPAGSPPAGSPPVTSPLVLAGSRLPERTPPLESPPASIEKALNAENKPPDPEAS